MKSTFQVGEPKGNALRCITCQQADLCILRGSASTGKTTLRSTLNENWIRLRNQFNDKEY